ncbi:MAG: 2-oxo-4-hydroxy-4-carboxy-5-ureidoimidazoline decarboxylase [Betaproteobacteria bacterium]
MTETMTLKKLNTCSSQDFIAAMAEVFEHAPWVAEAVVAERPFEHADALHTAMLSKVLALPSDDMIKLLAGHPELAGAHARLGQMTKDSVREQGGLSLQTLNEADARQWDALNLAYRDKFGFPFILCISRHSRTSALREFEARLKNDRQTELRLALSEIGRITRLRMGARVADHGMLGLTGVLSTHVLDTANGRPAEGVHVQLYEVQNDGARRLLVDAKTDMRGRTAKPLLSGMPLRIATYELVFHIGDYFMKAGNIKGDWPFLDVIPVRFNIKDPEGNYHVPLTATPWSYSTYRGQ